MKNRFFTFIALGMALPVSTPACAPPGRGAAADGAGTDGGGQLDRPADAKNPSDGAPPICGAGDRACDGLSVKACGAGGRPEGPVLEDCAGVGACSNGRCVSTACAEAEARRSHLGCRFYVVDADNTPFDDPQQLTIVIGNADATRMANVRLQARTGDTWTATHTLVVPPGGVAWLPLADSHKEGAGRFARAAFRLDSDLPLSAYAFNSDDQIEPKSESSGATLLIPAHVLGRTHFALGARMPAAAATPKSGASPAQIQIVGARDGTTVTVRPSADLRAGAGIAAASRGAPFTATLDEGDVLQLQTAAEDGDLSGSEILSDKPIAFFSGNVCASDGRGMSGSSDACDMTFEQLPPVEAWGKTYVGSRVLPQGTPACSKWAVGTVWRVVASEDATTVSFDADPAVTGLPPGPVKLGRGQFHELTVSGSMSRPGDFLLTADKPVLLAQVVPCEPSIGLAVSAEQMLSDFTFTAPSFFSNQLAITRRAGVPITLDGKPLDGALFAPAGGGFEVARILVEPCLTDPASCTHRIAGGDIGVIVRGMDGFCSYLYVGGMSLRCVNRTAGCR